MHSACSTLLPEDPQEAILMQVMNVQKTSTHLWMGLLFGGLLLLLVFGTLLAVYLFGR